MEGDWDIISCFLYASFMSNNGGENMIDYYNVVLVGRKFSYLDVPKMPPAKLEVITIT